MNNYDFGKLLSPLRFEQITRDLLSEKYGVFENFAEGRDNGKDFRYSDSNDNILIVQCKRYNNFNNLISTLKKEAIKIINLDFTTYLLVTSLSLTDNNKKKIVKQLKDKIEPKHIITRDELNYLLGLESNHYIEFKYSELWMKSINIHQKIFHIGFLNHSKFISEKVFSTLINFVPHKHFNQVINHFEKSNIVIISGNPGIGKTTLSYALISHYIYFKKFQLIDLSYRKIQEAESFLYQEKPTVFFIDDFLGKIKLNKGNDYSQLLYFMIEKIENSNHKLIITSREYILRRANKELFSINKINNLITKNVIELKSFTRRIRTEILFNYLKNSNLPVSKIENFLQSNYKKIIDHKNYNPRIIKELTKARFVKNIDSDNYYSFFIDSLNKPLLVWKNVYGNLPNKLYKLTILIKFLIEDRLPLKKLEKAINSIIETSKEFNTFSYDDFEYVMKELEGTFFTLKNGYDELIEEEYTLVEFQNPSVIDFVDNFIWDKTYWLKLIIKNAVYYEQIFNFELLEVIKNNDTLTKSFREKILKDFNSLLNANIGYFEFDTGETSFNCWTQERYNYFLHRIFDVLNPSEDKELLTFFKEEIFRYPFDGTEDISERQSFCQIAEVLLEAKVITGSEAIKHYTSGFLNHIKELVCFEYMTRKCDKKSLKQIRNNIQLAEEADNLFLNEIEFIKENDNIDFVDMLDFFDDYEQIKFILPLKKTTKKIEEFRDEKLWKEAAERLGKDVPIKESNQKKSDYEEYLDIDDTSIDNLFESIKKEIKTAANNA